MVAGLGFACEVHPIGTGNAVYLGILVVALNESGHWLEERVLQAQAAPP
jgi:hypothetical protein